MHDDLSEPTLQSNNSDAEQPRLDWRRAHEELSRLAKCRARLDWDEGRSLLDCLRSAAHLHLGFGSFGEYVERLLGYSRRSIDERLRVAAALEHLPSLGQALRDGRMSWSVVRELTRIATPENEDAWLDVARGRTVRQIEELVAGHQPGDRPDDEYDSAMRRHVLRFEVSAETFATFREAMAKLRRDTGSPVDDDAALLLLARQALEGPTEPGRANHQIALTVCEACGRGWQQGRGELVEVGSEVLEMARCDVQHRAQHRGQLIIEGRVSMGLVIRHADGTRYGLVADPRAVQVHEEAFRALRSLGFRESEARRGLERVRVSAHAGDANVPNIVRQVLAVLAADRQPTRSVDTR